MVLTKGDRKKFNLAKILRLKASYLYCPVKTKTNFFCNITGATLTKTLTKLILKNKPIRISV